MVLLIQDDGGFRLGGAKDGVVKQVPVVIDYGSYGREHLGIR